MLEKNKQHLEQCFLRMVIEGSYSLSETELNNWATGLTLSIRKGSWFCAVAKMTIPDFSGKEIVRLEQRCKRAISQAGIHGYAFLGSNMDIIMLIPSLENNCEVQMDVIEKFLSRREDCIVHIGVGNSYSKLTHLQYSKEEAYEALEWSSEQRRVAYIRDVGASQRLHTNIQENCQEIISQFKNGAIENLYTDLTLLAEQVRGNTVIQADAPYPTSIRRTMIELLVEMLHIAADAGVDVDAHIGYVDPYRKIFELQNTPAIIQWITEVAKQLCEATQARKKNHEITQLELAKSYIQKNLSDMELSLSSVGNLLTMSPSYFSTFFMREAGIGFKEYVTLQRIELAQKLLWESKDSVNTISEQCGFLSPSYFISVFKNQTGMTPGAYRKMKK